MKRVVVVANSGLVDSVYSVADGDEALDEAAALCSILIASNPEDIDASVVQVESVNALRLHVANILYDEVKHPPKIAR